MASTQLFSALSYAISLIFSRQAAPSAKNWSEMSGLLSQITTLLQQQNSLINQNFKLVNAGFTTLDGEITTINGELTPGQLPATATNDSAGAGKLGEYVSAGVNLAGALSISSGVPLNITSISLTAGDWDVYGIVRSNPSASASIASQWCAISLTSATLPSNSLAPDGVALIQNSAGFGASSGQILPCGPTRLSLASTTTVYLIGQISILSSTCTAYGFIRARRVR